MKKTKLVYRILAVILVAVVATAFSQFLQRGNAYEQRMSYLAFPAR